MKRIGLAMSAAIFAVSCGSSDSGGGVQSIPLVEVDVSTSMSSGSEDFETQQESSDALFAIDLNLSVEVVDLGDRRYRLEPTTDIGTLIPGPVLTWDLDSAAVEVDFEGNCELLDAGRRCTFGPFRLDGSGPVGLEPIVVELLGESATVVATLESQDNSVADQANPDDNVISIRIP